MAHAHAAPPMLASRLLSPRNSAEAHVTDTSSPRATAKLGTGCSAIDDKALDGGFDYGRIAAIAGNAGTDRSLIVLHALTTHLLLNPTSQAAIVDTTGAFSPVRLRDVVLARLPKGDGEGGSLEQEELMQKVFGVLDRVKVMRVFDVFGVLEAVDELRKAAEARAKTLRSHAIVASGKMDNIRGERLPIKPKDIPLEIPNSQDSDEEMMEWSPTPSPKSDVDMQQEGDPPTHLMTAEVGFLAIDTITNVISPLMGKGQVQGQALLTSLTRSISHLSRQYSICSILVNSAVASSSSSHSPNRSRNTDEDISIFAATHGRHALGRSFPYCVDVNLFVSKIPRSRVDAELAVLRQGRGRGDGRQEEKEGGDEEETNKIGEGRIEECFVLEVCSDRHGGREGRWGAFDIRGVELGDTFKY